LKLSNAWTGVVLDGVSIADKKQRKRGFSGAEMGIFREIFQPEQDR
jgi:hypothetical protein